MHVSVCVTGCWLLQEPSLEPSLKKSVDMNKILTSSSTLPHLTQSLVKKDLYCNPSCPWASSEELEQRFVARCNFCDCVISDVFTLYASSHLFKQDPKVSSIENHTQVYCMTSHCN